MCIPHSYPYIASSYMHVLYRYEQGHQQELDNGVWNYL